MRFLLAAFFMVCCQGRLLATDYQAPSGGEVLSRLSGDHPRLLVRPGDFDRLGVRIRHHERLNNWFTDLKHEAEDLIDTPASHYEIPDGKRLLSVSRRVLDRVYTLGMVYKLTEDRRFLDRLWLELEASAGFKDWNPSHFLDTGEMTHAFAIGYDWMFQDWTFEQRGILRKAIVQYGLEPGLASYRGEESYGWWVRAVHNWNQVCNGGMVLGALAIGDENSEIASEILEGALASIPLAMEEYAPDGGYKEGPGYWSYGTSYNIYLLAALESAVGTDFGLSSFEGFDETGLFPIYMTSPTGRFYNFADCHESRLGETPSLFWLGRKFGSPLCLLYASRFARGSVLDLLWYVDAPEDMVIEAAPGKYFPTPEVVTFRASWEDPEASFVGFKAGRPMDNHAQMDLGSFVYVAEGVRWAVDLGGDNYNLPGYFDRNNSRWKFYRNRAEGHNTIVLDPGNGPDQNPRADCRIIRNSLIDGMFAIADLTAAYSQSGGRVHRGVRLLDGRDLLVRDEIESDAGRVLWYMHTRAEIDLQEEGRIARLRQDGKELWVTCVEPADMVFQVEPAAPSAKSPEVEGQNGNRGVRKLALEANLDGATALTVWMGPERRALPQAVHAELADWR